LLQRIVTAVVPLASVSGCGPGEVGEDCYGTERQETSYAILNGDGTVFATTLPSDWDGGTEMPGDGGADAGVDCHSGCSRAFGELGCGVPSISGCSALGYSHGRPVIRCDLQYHRVCMPHGVVCGRRPAGFRLQQHEGTTRLLGGLLSQMASLEAASVPAFRILARELAAHGAPQALRSAAERAALDETRHTRMMSKLAKSYGGCAATVRLRSRKVRPLSRVIVENCVEGCVRETYGALVATWQARQAQDPRIRRTMRAIARDEVRHAALAFRVAAWADRRLDARQKARVEIARRRAFADLRRELSREVPAELVATAGLPSSVQALRLLEEMARVLEIGR
jgi:hypothetical protein